MEQVGNGENFTVLDEKINSVHSGSYGRLCWEDQAPTITTRFDTPAGGRFIHRLKIEPFHLERQPVYRVFRMISYFMEIKHRYVNKLEMQFHQKYHIFGPIC